MSIDSVKVVEKKELEKLGNAIAGIGVQLQKVTEQFALIAGETKAPKKVRAKKAAAEATAPEAVAAVATPETDAEVAPKAAKAAVKAVAPAAPKAAAIPKGTPVPAKVATPKMAAPRAPGTH